MLRDFLAMSILPDKPDLVDEKLKSKKKKRKTQLELFDVLNNKAGVTPPASALNPAKGLHSNAARWNESLAPKTFLVKRKKKKGLSILKKKILKAFN